MATSLTTEQAKRINERAKKHFENYKDHDTVLATHDGSLFFPKEKNAAEQHAKKLKKDTYLVIKKGKDITGDDTVEKKLTPEEEAKLTQGDQVKKLEALVDDGKFDEALNAYDALPDETKKQVSKEATGFIEEHRKEAATGTGTEETEV